MANNIFIQRFAAVIFTSILCSQIYAQHTTNFRFTETAPDNIRQTMQTNANAVFAEINSACDQNKSALALSSTNVTGEAKERIKTMWETSHFYCTKTYVNTRVLRSSNGYQVRNIPIFFEQGNTGEDKYQSIVIEFNGSGKISDLYIAIAPHQYSKIMDNSNGVKDLRLRQMVIDFVENFRTAYNRKDMPFLKDLYSEDALIITGKVLKPQKGTDIPKPTLNTQVQVEYRVQNKKDYLNSLQKVFNKNSYINIKFDDIVVTQHEASPNIYGVTLKQDWNASGGYHDTGWLFLMIDYEDENNPLIWVRTWQPLTDPNTGKEIKYNTEDIFGLGSFNFSK
jgi:hypothetical protein